MRRYEYINFRLTQRKLRERKVGFALEVGVFFILQNMDRCKDRFVGLLSVELLQNFLIALGEIMLKRHQKGPGFFFAIFFLKNSAGNNCCKEYCNGKVGRSEIHKFWDSGRR
jgi:hypothetical protein